MKNILVFGKDSYIGTNFEKWLNKSKEGNYNISSISSKDDEWRKEDFSKYDVIFCLAGIAHVSANKKLEDLYYKVNRDLPIEVAKKAKAEGVKQFIFMSSMIIYGADGKIGQFKIIKEDTSKVPIDFYGRSKLEADEAIQKLSDEKFKTIIIRAPMVYGPNCKGNFLKLKKIAKILPIFPDIENNRSMIYIDNLVECIKQNIDNENSGVIYPQNREYVSTKSIIEAMAKAMNKKMHFVKIFNPILKLLSKKINYINKIFGNKVYDKSLSGDFSYCVVDFETSIIECMK